MNLSKKLDKMVKEQANLNNQISNLKNKIPTSQRLESNLDKQLKV